MLKSAPQKRWGKGIGVERVGQVDLFAIEKGQTRLVSTFSTADGIICFALSAALDPTGLFQKLR